MRGLVSKYGKKEEVVCGAYALAEKRGEILRLRNRSGLSAEQYARALWRDGVAKGWF